MDEGVLKAYRKAGRIASEVRKEARSVVRVGESVLQICEKLERAIENKGGALAFPCNVCMNDVAAHYSSPPNDRLIIPEGALVKIDIGVHVDGYIADTATSIGFSAEHEDMIRSADEGLERAIKIVRSGIKASEVGDAIEGAAKRNGFRIVWNLSGHQLGRFMLHTGKSVPNVGRLDGSKLDEGEVYAIEPFTTLPSAAGEIRSASEAYIHRIHKDKPPKDEAARKLFKAIKSKFRNLPFSERWIVNELPSEDFKIAFSTLLSSKNVVSYPVLVEKSGAMVAQAEHTVVVTRNGCIVTTL